MAIFYNILQTGKGTIGNTYLRRTRSASGKEVNVLANKNFSPRNPKTVSQMAQRAKFATAVKFYKRAVRNFFKFAYEDQRANESDFNAFMRHNVSAALPMVKAQSESEGFPAVGKYWQLSQGSLTPFLNKFDSGDNSVFYLTDTFSASGTFDRTIGGLSKLLMAANADVKEGDIFTLVVVYSALPISKLDLLTADSIGVITSIPVWNVSQIIIDTSDTTELSKVNSIGANYIESIQFVNADENQQLNLSLPADTFTAACGILTRKVESSSKLLASSSWLAGNVMYDSWVSNIETQDYYGNMLVSWGADTSTVILKGSIAGADVSLAYPVINTVNGSPIPVTGSDYQADSDITLQLAGAYFDSERELTENSFTVDGGVVKSFTKGTGNTATLVVTASSGELSVSYGDTLLYKATQAHA